MVLLVVADASYGAGGSDGGVAVWCCRIVRCYTCGSKPHVAVAAQLCVNNLCVCICASQVRVWPKSP